MAVYHWWECLKSDMRQKLHQMKARVVPLKSRSIMMILLFGSVLIGTVFSLTNTDNTLQMLDMSAHVRSAGHCPDDLLLRTLTSQTYTARNPLLTLFTTFKRRQDRWRIHWNVLRNWSLLQPKVRMVLFDDLTDKSLIFFAKQHNWTVLPVPKKSVYGTPKLKDMYFRCQKDFPTSVYFGYANGDILFDEGLTDTLEVVTSYLDQLNQSLIVGMRTNFKVKGRRIMTLQEVRKLARTEGDLFRTDALDYFLLAHNAFPWDHVPDIVIGRPAYDNFLVATARKYDVSVIDATQTLVALHQTGRDGNYAGHRNLDAGYNSRLVGRFDYSLGLTSSAQYMTQYDRWGRVELWRKPGFGGQPLLLTPALTYTMPTNHSAYNNSNTVTIATSVNNVTFSINSSYQMINRLNNQKETQVIDKIRKIPEKRSSSPRNATQSRAKQKEDNLTHKAFEDKPNIKRVLLTLFTVFNDKSSSSALRFLHMNVLRNWAEFHPYIQTVLFTNSKDATVEVLAKNLKWTLIPAISQRGTVPPIKKMFLKVQDLFPESVFYGYINGNLLFSDGLIKTLSSVLVGLEEPLNALIVGMKYKAIIKEGNELYKPEQIQSVIQGEETMIRSEYDENFLLAHQTFPWQHIPELVIGRSVYNNYVVAQALRHEFPVVDATKTLKCLEQFANDPSLIPNELEDFDPNLLGTLDYSKGFAVYAQYETIYDQTSKEIMVIKRDKKPKV